MNSQKEDDVIETAFLVVGLLLFVVFLGVRSCVRSRNPEVPPTSDIVKAVTHE